jgi:hypothetical protein
MKPIDLHHGSGRFGAFHDISYTSWNRMPAIMHSHDRLRDTLLAPGPPKLLVDLSCTSTSSPLPLTTCKKGTSIRSRFGKLLRTSEQAARAASN